MDSSVKELEEARKQFVSLIRKTEKVLIKLKEGTAQHTLSVRRVAAYKIAMALLDEKLSDERAKLYPIILLDYNSEWKNWYASERTLIIKWVGIENIVSVNHIGSTSVPGLTAKPTVDILLEIHEGVGLEKLKAAFPKKEYVCLDRQTIPTNDILLFLKGYGEKGFADKVYHIHVRYKGDWDEIYFRDYLIAHPETAAEYAALKLSLKDKYEHDRDGYTSAKTKFITTITKKAREN